MISSVKEILKRRKSFSFLSNINLHRGNKLLAQRKCFYRLYIDLYIEPIAIEIQYHTINRRILAVIPIAAVNEYFHGSRRLHLPLMNDVLRQQMAIM